MDSFTIPNVTPELYKRLLQNLVQSGQAQVRYQQGSIAMISGMGVLLEVCCTGGALQVVVRDKPWLMPMGMIEGQVRAAVEQARTAL